MFLRHRIPLVHAFTCWILVASIGVPLRAAETITLKNGMTLQGTSAKIAAMGGEGGVLTPIIMVDDGLRRTFAPDRQVQNVVGWNPKIIKIKIHQRVATAGRKIGVVGPVIRIEKFDDYGRRRYTMNSAQGSIEVIQGITDVTPLYTKVEGLQTSNPLIWDMRIATNSIPRDVLSKILTRYINHKSASDRLELVRLYSVAERFDDARAELESIITDFPDLADLQNEVQRLRQLSVERLLREISRRREVGQNRLAFDMLTAFPSEGIAGEMLIKARDALGEYEETKKQGAECLALLKQHMKDLEASDKDLHERLKPIYEEISAELNINTLPRMADYVRLSSDVNLTVDQKMAVGITGWLMGGGASGVNMAVAKSLVEVRGTVRKYLTTKQKADRQALLQQLISQEGATPTNVAKILANMKPPVEMPEVQKDLEPGCFKLTTPGIAEDPEITYYVQLPPEYDPYRRYPCIVTLGSSGVTAKDQMAWWTGDFNEKLGMHVGHASRNGYIVISPQWTKEHQYKYEFSAREHAAVLNSLRDANRRFSIDTDRVFLSGHSHGGDAAWDIGLSHPDLWAGIIPIVATADKFIPRYKLNGRLLPMYFVGGELDADRIKTNGPAWDEYMTKVGYDVMVVDYLGRGHEHFQEEIHRIFEWMNLHRRDFFPKKFDCVSMRPWDNFFWFMELRDFAGNAMVAPAAWPPVKGTMAATISGTVLKNNGITVNKAADKITIWLSPEMVDFSSRITINTRAVSVAPSLEVMLEDARTRADRQHPFWAKVEHK